MSRKGRDWDRIRMTTPSDPEAKARVDDAVHQYHEHGRIDSDLEARLGETPLGSKFLQRMAAVRRGEVTITAAATEAIMETAAQSPAELEILKLIEDVENQIVEVTAPLQQKRVALEQALEAVRGAAIPAQPEARVDTTPTFINPNELPPVRVRGNVREQRRRRNAAEMKELENDILMFLATWEHSTFNLAEMRRAIGNVSQDTLQKFLDPGPYAECMNTKIKGKSGNGRVSLGYQIKSRPNVR